MKKIELNAQFVEIYPQKNQVIVKFRALILISVLLLSIALTSLSACTPRELRGRSEPSGDGKTYLIVEDDNGGQCGPLKVDGALWPYKIKGKGEISPGAHTIECGSQLSFSVKAGTIFYFDYWGP